ncbi:MAG: alanine racemase [Akkermansiaceae bacterium]|nr:alanine racemase [Akkermansiaceae bacterium]NNM30697.1 alanine racemase [Akkermansiaceae bacterium]
MESPPRAWAEIDLGALRHNLRVAREASGTPCMAVVKANAYGHGLVEVARTLEAEGVAFLGVANAGEARVLAQAGAKTPIYLLGPSLPEEQEEIVARGWVPCLSSLEEARRFDDLARAERTTLRVHLSVDTGMGRGGFLPNDAPTALDAIRTLPNLDVTGLGSHLPSADEDADFTRRQFELFDDLAGMLGASRPFQHIHLANSAGLLGFRSRTANLARPGLMLYGSSPLPAHQDRLQAVMTLKSRVSLIRELPPGHGVSYGRTFITERPTRVATIGIGYGDGYPRHLSGSGVEVLIRGARCPLLGRVTMDQIMADVTDLPDCKVDDEVELFGARIPVAEIAGKAGTIPWEIFTRVTERVARVYS